MSDPKDPRVILRALRGQHETNERGWCLKCGMYDCPIRQLDQLDAALLAQDERIRLLEAEVVALNEYCDREGL